MHTATALLLLLRLVLAPAFTAACCGVEAGTNEAAVTAASLVESALERPAAPESDPDSGEPCCTVCTTCCGQTATALASADGFRVVLPTPLPAPPLVTAGAAPASSVWHPPRV